MDKYVYWLDNVPGLGDRSKIRLLAAFHSCEEVYLAKERYLHYILEEEQVNKLFCGKRSWDVDENWEKLSVSQIQMTAIHDEKYPLKLAKIPDPPFCLYYRGKLPDEELPSIAIIGARQCSEYGRYIAGELGKSLGEHRIQVISGMATGIDGISQSAAMQAGGASFGVLGCGVDVCYPKSNQKLYEELVRGGGILSAYPPGTQPLKQLFPPRNRIVSGLSDVLVVIEARQKSGTSITVEMALEQGKDIYAVPGRVTDRLSDGCNKMLREGAHVFLSPEDFLLELKQLLPEKMELAERMTKVQWSEETLFGNAEKGNEELSREDKILAVLDFYPQYIEVIALRLEKEQGLKLSMAELNGTLIQMCLWDEVKQEGAGWFLKTGL